MGEWSEAMEDGVICMGCASPLPPGHGPRYCDYCAERRKTSEKQRDYPRDKDRNGPK